MTQSIVEMYTNILQAGGATTNDVTVVIIFKNLQFYLKKTFVSGPLVTFSEKSKLADGF